MYSQNKLLRLIETIPYMSIRCMEFLVHYHNDPNIISKIHGTHLQDLNDIYKFYLKYGYISETQYLTIKSLAKYHVQKFKAYLDCKFKFTIPLIPPIDKNSQKFVIQSEYSIIKECSLYKIDIEQHYVEGEYIAFLKADKIHLLKSMCPSILKINILDTHITNEYVLQNKDIKTNILRYIHQQTNEVLNVYY